MKSKLKMLFVTALLLFLASCASTGNKVLGKADTADLGAFLVKGQTTKLDVERKFGQPSNVDFQANNEKWEYFHTKSSQKATNFIPVVNWFTQGTNDDTKKLVLLFDSKGVLAKYAVTHSKGETKAGLIG
jgi:outer membrane protein assembly factor BamE (lipoprotein component of BamABCDE complex)